MFLSYNFIGFLVVLFCVYYLLPKKFQWILLIIFNFIFYFSAGLYYPVYLLVTSVTVYFAGIMMERMDIKFDIYNGKIKSGELEKPSRDEKKAYKKLLQKKKKRIMLFCLFINLGILIVVKYTNFVIDNINFFIEEMENKDIFYANGIVDGDWAIGETENTGISYINLIVPMGISFYTFQSIGYLLDVYWNKISAQRNFFKFTLFVSFFPQLIQGPISRYSDLSKTLYNEHKFDWQNVRFGIERIIWGYFKKLVVADRIAVALSTIAEDPKYYAGGFVFVGMMFYAAQLYADFTGGIDITIGIAQVLGIHLEENFIRPFFSKNIKEYWRRWHISMGTWFRDYVFYPCSISRPVKSVTKFFKNKFGMGAARRTGVYISTLVCWLATGIWHGAAWHYVVWGLLNGVIILASEELAPLYDKFHGAFPKLASSVVYRAFQVMRTFFLMSCLRLFDIYGSVSVAFRQFFSMFTKLSDHRDVNMEELLDLGLSAGDYLVFTTGVIIMFLVSFWGRDGSVREKISRKPYVIRYLIFAAMIFAVILFGTYGVGYDAQQFIYNRF